jgi:hypothetical protein
MLRVAQDCLIDEDPPVRVAFVWYEILDNWTGIVYDPTGAVLTKKGPSKPRSRRQRTNSFRLIGPKPGIRELR